MTSYKMYLRFCGFVYPLHPVKPAIVNFTVQPHAARVGESLTLNCSAVGFPTTLTYEIIKIGGGLVETTAGNVTLRNVNLTQSGEYTCIASCGFGDGPLYQCLNTTNAIVYGT